MKLIDADKILEALGVFKDKKHGDPHFLNGIETAREIVEQMPVTFVVDRDMPDDICFFRETLGES